MKSAPRPLITFVLAVVVLGWQFLSPAHAATGWETVRHNGQDYVTARSIKEFYGFQSMTVKGSFLELENKAVKIRFTIGGQEVFMNNVKFVFDKCFNERGGRAARCMGSVPVADLLASETRGAAPGGRARSARARHGDGDVERDRGEARGLRVARGRASRGVRDATARARTPPKTRSNAGTTRRCGRGIEDPEASCCSIEPHGLTSPQPQLVFLVSWLTDQ